MKVMQEDVAMKAMTKAIMESEKRVGCLESEKQWPLQTNEGVLQRSSLTRILPSKAKKTLVDSLHKEVIGIAVKVDDAIDKWCEKELSELTRYGEQYERSGRTVGRLGWREV